jgi:hypothetical protein
VATKAITGSLGNYGVNFTENLVKIVNMGVVGVLTISVFSAYQLFKLKQQGLTTRDAVVQVSKQATVSLILLAGSIFAQKKFGGYAGAIVSVGGIILSVIFSFWQSSLQRKFNERLLIYEIDLCRPTFVK